MKSALVVSVLLLVVLASGAFAQALFTPRALGMGNTQIGVANDAAAWYQNPAGLGLLGLKPKEGKIWANNVQGAYMNLGLEVGDECIDDSETAWCGTWSGWDTCKKYGFGGGYGNISDIGHEWGIGFGMSLPKEPLAFGLNFIDVKNDVSDDDCGDNSQTLLNFGAMYEWTQKNCAPIRLGAVVTDLTNQTDDGPFLGLGASWAAMPNLLIAADVNDVTSQVKTTWGAGAEYGFGKCFEWKARAGVAEIFEGEHDLSLGLGYGYQDWTIDAAWVDTPGKSTWSVGLGYNF